MPEQQNQADKCLLCGATENLTDEHVFPAALGGEDVVPSGTCSKCNGDSSRGYEAEFNNALKTVCHVLGIGNRQGDVPSIPAMAVIDGTKFNLVLDHGGKFRLQEKKEERVLENGKKVIDYFLFSDEKVKEVQERLQRRGERLVQDFTPQSVRPIEFEPESFMPLDFIAEQLALRTATKVAYFVLVKKAGRTFAQSAAFDDVREHLLTGTSKPTRLFVNENYAANTHVGPHQHMVQIYCNGKERTVYAVFGGLTYLVQLSATYQGADYGFTYAYDALQRKETGHIVGELDNERLATEDVRSGKTIFDNVRAMADHWAKYIQLASPDQIRTTERRVPGS
jgi:hypothetical protein